MPHRLRHVPALLGALLLFGALYAVQREFRSLQLDAVGQALDAIPARALLLGFLFTALSYAGLTLYDWLGTIYAGHRVGYGRVAFASFCAYALSHNLGFAAVSGAAVRYRLYAHWGLAPGQIARVVAFCSLTFGLGGMVLGGAILFVEPRAVPFFGDHLPPAVLYGFGVLLWGVVVGYVTLARWVGTIRPFGHTIELPGFRMALAQVALATADVALTATIFWVLVPHAPGLNWLIFLGIYVTAYTAGLAANVPGGIGVFDSAVLFGLAPYLAAPRIVAAVVVFRLYYYVIPLFLAGSMFAGNEVLLRGEAILGRLAHRPIGRALGRVGEPDFAVAASTGAATLSGLLLLGVGVLAPSRGGGEPVLLSDLANHAGQFVPSLIGAALVVVGLGLVRRVTLAWWASLLLLAGGALFMAGRSGAPGWIAGVLVLSALLLAPFRALFYRPARLTSGKLEASAAAPLLALVLGVLGVVGFRRHIAGLTADAWWEIVLAPGVPVGLRVSVALTVVPALIAVWALLRPGRTAWQTWDMAAQRRFAGLGAAPPARADGLVWGESGRAAIPFLRRGRVLLGLGDPAGASGDRISAVWRLRDLAEQEGRDPAIWRAGPELLKIYADLGLTGLPLGPDGLPEAADRVPPAGLYLVCAAERDLGLLVALLPDPTKE